MDNSKRDFDSAASTWDEKPGRVAMAEAVFRAIMENVDLKSDMDVLDFGSGTGLLSLLVLPHVRSVTCADSSAGMLDVLNSKIKTRNLENVRTIIIDIENGDALSGEFDAVTSSMTMHHVKNIKPVLKEFQRILKPGGSICIADLDPDEGKFHDDNTGVHHFGFDRDEFRAMLEDSGFSEVSFTTAFEVPRPDGSGNMVNRSVFLVTAKKSPVHS